jgi:hypothetical protein
MIRLKPPQWKVLRLRDVSRRRSKSMPRPKFQPTQAERDLVRSHAAVGTPQKVIARLLKVRSPKTIRKYFRDELDLGLAEANASVAGELYNNATRGDTNAQKFWLINRAGWGIAVSRQTPVTPPPFVVAVEEDDEKRPDKEAA